MSAAAEDQEDEVGVVAAGLTSRTLWCPRQDCVSSIVGQPHTTLGAGFADVENREVGQQAQGE